MTNTFSKAFLRTQPAINSFIFSRQATAQPTDVNPVKGGGVLVRIAIRRSGHVGLRELS